MADFAGYNMAIQYTSITDEHHSVRNNVGIFDVSHMGEFIVKGKEALDLVQKVTSNDASKLGKGEAQYSCLPNLTGGIVDDLLVYRLGEDMCNEGELAFMLVVNASNIEKDWNWISGSIAGRPALPPRAVKCSENRLRSTRFRQAPAARRISAASAVAWFSVWSRVTMRKSSKRSLMPTVRAT